jgi:hypothetical protein
VSGAWCKTSNSCGVYYDGFLLDNYWYDTCTPCDDDCGSCTSPAQPATQLCASCESDASLSNGECIWDVQEELDGCFLDANCQSSCGSSQRCVEKDGPFQACYGVGNAGGWNKYTCEEVCYADSTCGGACGATASCKRAILNCVTGYQCSEPECTSGQYAMGGVCYSPAPPTPPAPLSCPTLLTSSSRRLLGDEQEEEEPAAASGGDGDMLPRPRSVRAAQRPVAGAAGEQPAGAGGVDEVMAEEDAIQAALLSGAPEPVPGESRLYYKRFRHHSTLTGELTVLDYQVQLQPGVVNVDTLLLSGAVSGVACSSASSADGDATTVMVSLPGGDGAAGMAAAFCDGCRVLLSPATAGACASLQHRIVAPATHDAAVVTFTAVPEADGDAFINSTAFTFFQGAPATWVRHVAARRVMRFARAVPEPTTSSIHGRALVDALDNDIVLPGLDVFSIQQKNIYCDSAAVVACTNCRLTGQVDVLVSVDPGSALSTTEATGTLSLTLQAIIRLRGGATTVRNEIGMRVPWCIPPACYGVSLWNVAYLQVGMKFGMHIVAETTVAASGDINLDASASLSLSMRADNGDSTPTFSVAVSNPDSTTNTRTPLLASAATSLGLKPIIQVGVWGGASFAFLGAQLSVYAEGAFTLYARFTGTYSSVMLASNALLVPANPVCASPHNLELSAALGIEDGYLSASVQGSVTVISTYNLGPFTATASFPDSSPFVVWATCINLTPPPPPSPRPSPPPPPLPPGQAAAPAPVAVPSLVALSLKLAGYTAATFNTAAQSSFRAGIASAAGVAASAVTISSFSDAAVRRTLLTTGLLVQFTVSYPSQATASSGASALNTAVSSGQLQNTLLASGLSQVTSLTATAPAFTAVEVATPAAPAADNSAAIGGVVGGGGGALIVGIVVTVLLCRRRKRRLAAAAAAPPASPHAGGEQAAPTKGKGEGEQQTGEFTVTATTTTVEQHVKVVEDPGAPMDVDNAAI